MSEEVSQPSGSGKSSGTSGAGGTPKAIASLAKKSTDTTRLGTTKMKFVPTLPVRRKKEEAMQESAPTPNLSSSTDRGRGRGQGRGRGNTVREGAGRGRGAPIQGMTASGPFAMGPTLAGSSSFRRSRPRSHTPIVPLGSSGASALGAGLTRSAAPSLKRERGEGPAEVGLVAQSDAEVYSDPEDGVEIVDMENVKTMDWMAPESLKKEREGDKRRKRAEKIKIEARRVKDEKGKGVAKVEEIEVDSITPSLEGTPATAGGVDLANALDLSDSEDEEEMDDLVEDFSSNTGIDDQNSVTNERVYLFQFPEPFPTFIQKQDTSNTAVNPGEGKGPEGPEKRVSFAQDTKPPADPTADIGAVKSEPETFYMDGVIGQLEIYESGAVKMRLQNGILLDVSAGTQASFLQQAIHVDRRNKNMNVLGEVSRRFVVTPNVDALLDAMLQADQAALQNVEDNTSNAMDTNP